MLPPQSSGRNAQLRVRSRGIGRLNARLGSGIERLETRTLLSALQPNVSVTADPGVQQAPSLAVDPADTRHLVMAYQDRSLVTTGYAGIGVAISRDAGSSWTHRSLPLPDGFDQGAFNPIVRFNASGEVFVSFMAATFLGPKPPITSPDFVNAARDNASDRAYGFESNNGIFVSRSGDGGDSWQTPTAVISHHYAGTHLFFEVTPDLAIDTFRQLSDGSPNPHFGEMVATWTRLYPAGQFPDFPESAGGSDLMIAVSDDHGQTWNLRLQPDPGTGTIKSSLQDPLNAVLGGDVPEGTGYVDQSHPAIGPEGDIYVGSFMAGDFNVFHSSDDGAHFDAPAHNRDERVAFGLGFSTFTGATLPNNQFRTNTVRSIAVDPIRPGTIYATEQVLPIDATSNKQLDPADIFFARSTDYGKTWQRTFRIGSTSAQVLNDDNGGRIASSASDDVTSGQALPRVTVDENGNVAVIWYDTRRDPSNHLLDVFGTVSIDGGQTFSPNFRITDQSFDADAGRFTDATGGTNYYLGDAIGLAAGGGVGFAAWTDTRGGSQDVRFSRFPLNPTPSGANDRFEPNDSPATPTDLGAVVRKHLVKLGSDSGDEDWFRVQTSATGSLTATVTPGESDAPIRVEIWDASGTHQLAEGAELVEFGSARRLQVVFPTISNQTYLIRVTGGIAAGSAASYSLDVLSVTADLGTVAYTVRSATLKADDQLYFLATAAAAGSVQSLVSAGTDLHGSVSVELLDPDTLEVLTGDPKLVTPGSPGHVSIPVAKSQIVLVRLSTNSTSAGSVAMELTNFDQFSSPERVATLLPDGAGPSKIAVADLNADGIKDLVVSHTLANWVSVFLGNGDGTFQSPRQFNVGAFSPSARGFVVAGLPNYGRGLVIADVNGDARPDIMVTNFSSSDVSVLLGRGDGTFSPERRFDATPSPMAIDAGDVNHDGKTDLVVMDAPDEALTTVVCLLGLGDGSFKPPIAFQFRSGAGFGPGSVQIADFNRDSEPDVAVAGLNGDPSVRIFFGLGDGTFQTGPAIGKDGSNVSLTVADVNGDNNLDLITTAYTFGTLSVFFGNGDGTFQDPQSFFAGDVSVAVKVADLGSQSTDADGNTTFGPPDGHPDLVVANSGASTPGQSRGLPGVVVLPALFDDTGSFGGFGSFQTITTGDAPTDLALADFDGDGTQDLAVVDHDGVRMNFGGQPPVVPHDTPQSARNLGSVVHLALPTLTVTPGNQDAFYRLTVPVEAARGSGDEILDISALFRSVEGAGLGLAVLDPTTGKVIASGERTRFIAAQGQELLVHVFGKSAVGAARGTGAYILEIDVLPQLVGVEAPPLLVDALGRPAGPTSSLVITFQGDRLETSSAEDPANYRITWLGPDGRAGTSDDRTILAASNASTLADVDIVYAPGTNVDVATGRAYPTSVRQTATFVFSRTLPAGNYQIELLPGLVASPLNDSEAGQLVDDESGALRGHPIASVVDGDVTAGSQRVAKKLVAADTTAGSVDTGSALARSAAAWASGTPFLTQLHDDLGALLDADLTAQGDRPAITGSLLDQIIRRLSPGLSGVIDGGGTVLVIWLDPVSIGLTDPGGNRAVYDLQTGQVANQLPSAFVSVAGNVEVLVVPVINKPSGGVFALNVSDVASTSRGGAAILTGRGANQVALTDALRNGQRSFEFQVSAGASGIVDSQLPVLVVLNTAATNTFTSDAGTSSSIAAFAVGRDQVATAATSEPVDRSGQTITPAFWQAIWAPAKDAEGNDIVQQVRRFLRELFNVLGVKISTPAQPDSETNPTAPLGLPMDSEEHPTNPVSPIGQDPMPAGEDRIGPLTPMPDDTPISVIPSRVLLPDEAHPDSSSASKRSTQASFVACGTSMGCIALASAKRKGRFTKVRRKGRKGRGSR